MVTELIEAVVCPLEGDIWHKREGGALIRDYASSGR